MTVSAWQLDGNQATLRQDNIAGVIRLDRPSDGVHDVKISNQVTTDLNPLCVRLPGSATIGDNVSDSYVRCNDLVVQYDESTNRPFHVQIYWRALPTDEQTGLMGGVELMTSVNTSGLDIESSWSLHTDLPSGELLRLKGDEQHPRFETVDGETAAFNAADGPGLFLLRPVDADWSYAEMVHPIDFQAAKLESGEEATARRLVHSLFHREMEKGVIVRNRVQAVFLRRDQDETAAVGCFEAFRHAKLPLTA